MGAPLPQLNRIAIGADEAAPEADLSQMMIRRRKSAAAERVAALEIGRGDVEPADVTVGDGLFFKKGFATAEGFRPSYWVYERHSRDEPAAAAVSAAPDASVARGASAVPINLDAEPDPEDEAEPVEPAAARDAPQPAPLGDAPGLEPEADRSTILNGRSSA